MYICDNKIFKKFILICFELVDCVCFFLYVVFYFDFQVFKLVFNVMDIVVEVMRIILEYFGWDGNEIEVCLCEDFKCMLLVFQLF